MLGPSARRNLGALRRLSLPGYNSVFLTCIILVAFVIRMVVPYVPRLFSVFSGAATFEVRLHRVEDQDDAIVEVVVLHERLLSGCVRR